jgi:hypothetical protein
LNQSEIQKLKEEWGLKKFIPPQYEVAVLKALSRYPELKQVNIRIIPCKQNLFRYSARPSLTSLFGSREQREYFIFILEETKDPISEKALLKNLPLDAQVGVLGHELAHVADYNGRSTLSLLKLGLLYFLPSFRRQVERATDRSAIQHGLKKELYACVCYVKTIPGFIENNKWVEKYYLKAEEILDVDYHEVAL